jgi:hypothetical protein
MKNFWEKTFGAARRRSDRALLASMERDLEQAERAEALARKIAAQKMGLIKDPDGKRLPDDLWKQAEAEAKERIARAFGRPLDSQPRSPIFEAHSSRSKP